MSGTLPNQFRNSNNEEGSVGGGGGEEEDEDDVSSSSRSSRVCSSSGVVGGGDDDIMMRSGRMGTSLYNNNNNSGSAAGVSSCVQVALRIRPLLPREVIANSRECISVTPGEPQVLIGSGHAFTYDYVFNTLSAQDDVFSTVAKPLVDGILEGYNATILAYGQTGSGKTYTMGTGFDPTASQTTTNSTGILPRCINYLFSQISTLKSRSTPPPDFKVSVQFTELYNEEVIDLLSDTVVVSGRPGSARSSNVKIHEQANGQIYLVNINTKPVQSELDTLDTLRNGALNRTTASTNMNDSSSRSHAIFSIMVTQNRVVFDKGGAQDIETLHGKFHFVDLAGSERLKRTLATGDRAKEGIAINSGLLALGNVISALGDKAKKALHVPYRDSKLTRLLQDSLGGNSRTLMIACVSPNELDFVETLNTMKYANRAKNIKNKVVLNQDKSSRTINMLREEISRLQAELSDYKRGVKSDFDCGDVNAENMLLLAEVDTLRCKVKSKQDCIDQLTSQVARLQACKVSENEGGGEHCDLTTMVTKYLREIEELRAKLYESEMECEKLRGKQRVIMKNLTSPRDSSGAGGGGNIAPVMLESVNDLLNKAKQEVEEEAKGLAVRNNGDSSDDEDDDDDDDDDEEEDSAEDSNTQQQQANYSELANLTQEINTKQRLIEELENSQLRLESLKNKYEEKIAQLGCKIKSTEQERDTVLKSKTLTVDKSKEYETKIQALQAEIKKWGNAKREHAKLMRNQSQYETQIMKLKSEVEEMKRVKVKLMNQVKQDNARFRELDKQRQREITQLRKETRIKDIRVKKLESDSRLKEQVLKRKVQEVEMLKRNKVNSAAAAASMQGRSPVKGKQVWGRVQGMLMKDVNVRQNTALLEREMVGLIARRSELQCMLEGEVDRECVDSIKANLAVVEEKIQDVQDEIVRGGGETDGGGSKKVFGVVGNLGGKDMSYLVEKLYDQSVQGLSEVQQLEDRVKEVEEVNKHLATEVDTLRELLHHMYNRPGQNVDAEQQQQQQKSTSMLPPPPPPPAVAANHHQNQPTKARRRLTSTTQELLGSAESIDNLDVVPRNSFTRNRLTQSMRDNNATNNSRRKLTRQDTYNIDMDRTFIIDNNTNNERASSGGVSSSSEVVDTANNSSGFANNSRRKSPRSNAWLQLTRTLEGHSKQILCLSATEEKLVSGSKDGSCRVWDLETGKCIQTFDSHPHNVSCVCFISEMSMVMTGSSYQLRMFDLKSGSIIKVLSSSGQVLSSLQSSQPIPPIPSLPPQTSLPRVNDLPTGEKSIFSIQKVRNYFFTGFGERIKIWDVRKLASIGTLAGKHNSSVMCLTGKPDGLRNNDWLITGSKDHTLKLYEYGSTTPPENITSIRNLNPPHYDGIECLYLHGDSSLYSGSRDTCIKKWDLNTARMVSTVTNAHSGWVTGLCGVPGVVGNNQEFLVSCSRDGTLKLWDCAGNEFREVCRYESNIGLECVGGNSRLLFFGGGASSASGAVLNNNNEPSCSLGLYKISDNFSKNLFSGVNVGARGGGSGGSVSNNNSTYRTQYMDL